MEQIIVERELDIGIRFEFDLVETSDVLDEKVDYIFVKLGLNSGYKQDSKKKLLKLVIVNLINAYKTKNTLFLVYTRDSGAYRRLATKHGKHVSFRTMMDIIKGLESLGFIEHHKGVNFPSFKRQSRMKMNTKLLDLITNESILLIEIDVEPTKNCIIFRKEEIATKPVLDEDKKQIILKRGKNKGKPKTEKVRIKVDKTYKETKETKRMRSALTAYNNLLKRTFIDIPDFPEDGLVFEGRTRQGKKTKNTIRIDDNNKFVRRIFNNESWADGGRYYGGWWTNLPEEWRNKIKVNDEWTVEVDYSGLHFKLLYNYVGINYKDDPYEINIPYFESANRNDLRNLIKVACLILINAKDEKSTIKGIIQALWKHKDFHWFIERFGEIQEKKDKETNEIIREKKLTKELINKLLGPIKLKHKRIQKYFMSGIGITLMNMDSEIAQKVINFYTMEEVPILCIHDSFIIPISYAQDLKRQMAVATQEIIGKRLETKQNKTKSYEHLFLTMTKKSESPEWKVKANKRYRERLKQWKNQQECKVDYYYYKEEKTQFI